MLTKMMSLQTLLEKSSDTDLLREMIGFAAHRLMELAGAAHGQRSADRITHRNGYRDRDWETRAGTVEAHSETAERKLLSGLPRAAPDGGEGGDSGDPGSLPPGRPAALAIGRAGYDPSPSTNAPPDG